MDLNEDNRDLWASLNKRKFMGLGAYFKIVGAILQLFYWIIYMILV